MIKNTQFITPSKTIVGSLLIALLMTAGCQKAKMQVIPRSTGDAPAATEPATPLNENEDSEVVTPPPVIVPPSNTHGEVVEPVLPAPLPEVVIPAMPVEPQVSDQPTIPHSEPTVGTWLDPNAPAHPSVLNQCAFVDCLPTARPIGPVEKKGKSYQQPAQPLTNMLDVIFVVDTSNSLDEERSAIAKNIKSFIQQLSGLSQRNGYNKSFDLEIGVLLAHGPQTDKKTKLGDSAFANLYVHPEEASQSHSVLSSQSQSIAEIQQALLSRFNGGPNGKLKSIRDTSSAQGEVGLLALETYLQREIRKSSGFPRRNAALMVLFVSDENDVCFDYNGANEVLSAAGSPLLKPHFQSSKSQKDRNGIERDEPEHLTYINACGEGTKGQSHSVAHLLRTIKGHSNEVLNNTPILATGVIYWLENDAANARNKNDQFHKDNEVGHGYYDLISQFEKGLATSPDATNFGEVLANFGKSSIFSMNYQSSLPLQDDNGQWLNLEKVPVDQIRVTADIKVGARAGETVVLSEGTDYNIIPVASQQKTHAGVIQLLPDSQVGMNWENAIVNVHYRELGE